MVNDNTDQTWSNSDAYEALIGRWSRPAAEAMAAWLNLPSGLRWLDVGCGPGALTEAILENAQPTEILGIDPSEEFLTGARARFLDERVAFSQGDAHTLEVSGEPYDVVVSGLVLHFLSDPPMALHAMSNAARPGGTVAGSIWAISSEDQFTRPFWRAALAVDPSSVEWDLLHTRPLNSQERLFDLFAGASLEQVSTAILSFPVTFRDFDDYWQPCLLDGTTPIQRYAHSLSDERQAALREQLRAELSIASDGSIALLGHLWVARGVTAA